jgi:hypothetical protein
MKNKLLGLLLLSAFLLTGCVSVVNGFVKDAIVLNEYLEEKATEGFSKDKDNFVNTSDEKIDFTVWGFSEECVVLNWKAERTGVRYKIYVKDKNKKVRCVENNYGKTNYFMASDSQSSYAIGILLDDKEIYRTNFIYPDLEDGKGFPVYAEIADDGYLGVECLYPSNVDLFSLLIVKENATKNITTKKFPAKELNHYLLPIRYEKNRHNNYFTLVFTIGETEYISAKYYFDYAHHTEASKLDEDDFITFYPSL